MLPGYVVGAGVCVEGAAVAGFGGRKKKTKLRAVSGLKYHFIRCIPPTRSKFWSHPIGDLSGKS